MFDSTQPASRAPLLYLLGAVCLLALFAAVYLTLTGGERSERPQPLDPAAAADKDLRAANLTPEDRSAMEAVVRNYILSNPEIITEAVDILQKRDAQGRLANVRSDIETPFPGAVAGNANGQRVLVEFFDYACGFCSTSVPDLNRLIASDRNLKVVFRELPILGKGSEQAARMALAAARQGKYKAFHDAMYAAGKPTEAAIAKAATVSGLDMTAARQFAQSDMVTAELRKNFDLARSIGFSGTPTWVTGDDVLEGAVGFERLKQAVGAAD